MSAVPAPFEAAEALVGGGPGATPPERGGRHPLEGRSARAGHEILMAAYESARQRARIDLPLSVMENPLEAMAAAPS